jgi:branched-chain amino acid transport system ATP-binding protein
MTDVASTPALRVTNLDVRYGAARALFAVSFDVPAGNTVAILGPNGAGKSSIARAVSGLVAVHSGQVVLAGEDVTNKRPHVIRRQGLLHLPEGRGIFPALTVEENLRMAGAVLTRAQRNAGVERGFEIFTPLAGRRRQQAGTLSGGEQQMLSLARALVVAPKVVVADEMSLGLAPKMVDLIFDSLRRAQESGVAVVLIEQFIHRALGLAQYCVMLQRGAVVWAGPSTGAKDEIINRYLAAGAA